MRRTITFTTLCLALLSCSPKAAVTSAGPNGQGWNHEEQATWYRGSQGSRLLPWSWLLALEEANSAALFLSPESVKRFGYLLPDAGDPVQLPIGFALDAGPIGKGMATDITWTPGQGQDVRWVGMNCAACHTAQIEAGGKSLRIDGGPTTADFQGFERSLNAALEATASDDAKFGRFAEAVLCTTNLSHPLGAAPTRGCAIDPQARARLKAGLDKLVERQRGIAALNQTQSAYGYARLDAVGHILNKIAYLAQAPGQFAGTPDAPVSYPFIWNAPQHDFVQWNGIAPNKGAKLLSGQTFDVGAIVRNTSEVVGVFADVEVAPKAMIGGYRSSVNVTNLDAIEAQLSRLQSPAWPADVWPRKKEDLDLAENVGKPLFAQRCAACHAPLDRTDTHTPIKAIMTPIWAVGGKEGVGTDPWMACNAFTYEALTGMLNGKKSGYLIGDRFGSRTFTRQMLVATGIGVLAGKKPQLVKTATLAAFGLPRTIETVTAANPSLLAGQASKGDRLRDCRGHAADPLMAYKGRPLNGVWATAPYLHNGSVKSLYELLLDPAKRSPQFWVGNHAYDPVNVGYKDEQSKYGSMFRTVDDAGNAIDGNSNLGHDYGNASLTDTQRKALVEYLKGL